jgi:hypothetical protein
MYTQHTLPAVPTGPAIPHPMLVIVTGPVEMLCACASPMEINPNSATNKQLANLMVSLMGAPWVSRIIAAMQERAHAIPLPTLAWTTSVSPLLKDGRG